MANDFNVLDMAEAIAAQDDIDVSDLFTKPKEDIPKQTSTPTLEQVSMVQPVKESKPVESPKSNEWTPDASLLEDMPEMNAKPVTYSKEEFKEEDHSLHNLNDEEAVKDAANTADDLTRKNINIEAAKKRHGITKLAIDNQRLDTASLFTAIMVAAGNPDYDQAQKELDDIFNDIKANRPDLILERTEEAEKKLAENVAVNSTDAENTNNAVPVANISTENVTNSTDVSVIIDKTSLPNVSFTAEDMEKIRKSRRVELNIVERKDLEFSSIDDIDGNAIDEVLMPYHHKVGETTASLPASKYRACFTGLTYTEVIDLSTSINMNNIDGEIKKWTIAFDHIKNQSIGPWEEYRWYIDPVTKKKVKININAPDPDGINPVNIYNVSKFEDFLMKTSYLDLDFILWKILCATSNEKEIISITCNSLVSGGVKCRNRYDWLYNPEELLDQNSINPTVLEEMKQTGEAGTTEEILENYNTSLVRANNTVTLPTSKFILVFGHVSAYTYLNDLYSGLKEIEEEVNKADNNDESTYDPTIGSKFIMYSMLTITKAILIPKKDGSGYLRVKDVPGIIKIFKTFDEIDLEATNEIFNSVITPYKLKFRIPDIICPKCHSRSNVPINNMADLLFILSQSLNSVEVILKRQ